MAARTTRKKSNDFTGQQAEALAKEAAEEKQARAQQMSMMTAEKEREFEESVHDMTQSPDSPVVVDEVLDVGVVMEDDSIVIRVAEDIENMTFGYGNNYTFKAGGKYKVPRPVGDRLESLGLLYERL